MSGRSITSAADAAQALRPLAGEYAYICSRRDSSTPSLFAASILPISTAYAVCEGLGSSRASTRRSTKRRRSTGSTRADRLRRRRAARSRVSLFQVMVLSQVANGVLLPFVLIFVLMLVNDSELMGSHTNSRGYNIASWITVVVMIGLTMAMLVAQMRG
jgi:Mn2+/Fe2+ NRAMP family transporter